MLDNWKTKYHSEFHVEWPMVEFDCTSSLGRFGMAVHTLNSTVFRLGKDGSTPDFYKWVTGIITKTVYKPKHDTYEYAAASSAGGTLWIHDLYFAQSLEWRTSVLVHETRHSDAGDPSHVMCEHGDTKGKMACDNKFYDGEQTGSGYNYDFNFYWWIKDGTARTSLSKEVAKSQMKFLLLNRFNEISNDQVQKFFH